MIFLTVGTSFPFNRLVRAVETAFTQGKIEDEIFAQVGRGGYRPQCFNTVETLDKKDFDEYFKKSKAIIAHAGMGTIIMALDQNKPAMILPRLKEYGELVNDHQMATARRFEQLGHILAAYDIKTFMEKLPLLKSFQPIPRTNQAQKVAERIGVFLHQYLPNQSIN